jgi:hypothetical protein
MSDASVNIEYSPDKVRTLLGLDAKLADVAFGIESTINYFFGRSVYRWSLERSSIPQKRFLMNADALCTPTDMVMSQIASVGMGVQSGTMPRQFKPQELWDREGRSSQDNWLPDGQHRLGSTFMEGDHNVSIVHGKEVHPHIPLGHLSYGLADMITGFFFRGVHYVKWQGSQRDTQLYIRHQMSHKEIWQYLLTESSPENPDYDLNMTIGEWLAREQS